MCMYYFNQEMTLAQRAGRNLDRELWKRHIKQVDFARQIGRTTRTVRRWMYEGIPLLSDIELVATALGVSARDILFGEEDVSSFLLFYFIRTSDVPKRKSDVRILLKLFTKINLAVIMQYTVTEKWIFCH